MSARERQQFYTTPEGGSFLQAASNYSALRGQMEELDASGDPDEQAVLSENLNLQLRALNRGNILPPVPISQDALGSNPEFAQTIWEPDSIGVQSDVNLDGVSDILDSQEQAANPAADLSMVPRGAAAGGTASGAGGAVINRVASATGTEESGVGQSMPWEDEPYQTETQESGMGGDED